MALTTTIAGLTSDSYASLTYADGYFTDHFDKTKSDAWDLLTDPQKERALVQACQIINTLSFWESNSVVFVTSALSFQSYVKSPAVLNQALAFPRNVDIDSNGASFIPVDVLMAQCEQAIYLVQSMNESTASARMQGLLSESVKAGSVAVSQTYADGSSTNPMLNMLSPFALSLLKKYFVTHKRFARE